MDELNEYLECTCVRCDDGICRGGDFDDGYNETIEINENVDIDTLN